MVKQQSYSLNPIEHDSLNPPDNGCVVGVDIGGTNLRLALADMTGAVLGRWSTSSVGIHDPHEIVALIRAGVEHLLNESCGPRRRCDCDLVPDGMAGRAAARPARGGVGGAGCGR